MKWFLLCLGLLFLLGCQDSVEPDEVVINVVMPTQHVNESVEPDRVVTRRPNSETICKSGGCITTLGGVAYSNESGEWLSIVEDVNLTWNAATDSYRISRGNAFIDTQPRIVRTNGQIYNASRLANDFPNIRLGKRLTTGRFQHKYEFLINLSLYSDAQAQNIVDQIELFQLVIVGWNGFTGDDVVQVDNFTWVIKGKYVYSLQDLLDANYTVIRDDKFTFNVSNVQQGYDSVTKVLTFDPTIHLNVSDGENLDDTHVRTDQVTTNFGGVTPMRVHNSTSGDQMEILMQWNITTIPADQTILNASLRLNLATNGLDGTDVLNVTIRRLFNNYTCNVGGDTHNPWDEACVTFQNGPGNGSGNFLGPVVDTIIISVGDPINDFLYNWSVTSIISDCYDEGRANCSFYLQAYVTAGNPSFPSDRLDFDTKEDTGTNQDPQLSIGHVDAEAEVAAGPAICVISAGDPAVVQCNCTINFTQNMERRVFIANGTATNRSLPVNGTLFNFSDATSQNGCTFTAENGGSIG